MIRTLVCGAAAAAALLGSSAALAKQYVDYAPEKGVWEINAIEVDPNHVDDYLTGLRKSQVPGFEVLKRHGIIDDYRFVVRNGYNKGAPNVLIETHYPSIAMVAPDKARDQMVEKEIYATFSEEAGKVAVAGYEKYRQFIDDGFWSEVTFAK
jgi:hypothetical protein